jgi:UDP-N-acetyl-D-mannosaminuronate dehydrogenase
MARVGRIDRGESHIQDVTSGSVRAFVRDGRLSATADLSRLSECDAISIHVSTPLSKTRDPDLSSVVSATRAVQEALRASDCVVIVTAHTTLDHPLVAATAPLVVDTRGVLRGVPGSARISGPSGRESSEAPFLHGLVAVGDADLIAASAPLLPLPPATR